MLFCTLFSISDASSVGVGKSPGTDTGSSTVVDEPALLGILKLGPQGFGLAAGVSTNAEAVLEAAAGVSVLFLNRNCLKRARRSGSIFFGIVMVFLAAFSCNTVTVMTDVYQYHGSMVLAYTKQMTIRQNLKQQKGVVNIPQHQYHEDAV